MAGLKNTWPRHQIFSPLADDPVPECSKDFHLSPGQPAAHGSETFTVGMWGSDMRQNSVCVG